MDKLDRMTDLYRTLSVRRTPIALRDLMRELECSESTVRRALCKLRDELNASVIYDRHARGWLLDRTSEASAFPFPSPWLSAAELHALLSCHQLLSQIQPGLIGGEIAPLTERIEAMLAKRGLDRTRVGERVRLIAIGARRVPGDSFKVVAQGLLQHRRIRITYRSRSRDQISGRTLSPQRLTWYRSNWYLDAWCHEREALRCFALERLTAATLLETPAHDVLSADLDAHFADAYGIFTGPATQTATLIFSRERARWVADEEWHPHQQGRHLPDGRYELTLPYGRADELIMDILKYGPDVEVTAPDELRTAVVRRLEEASAKYC